MRASFAKYDVVASADRIDEILEAEDESFEEVNSIPSRDSLTFSNGYYVNCSALFIDIRKSSELPSKYQRPTLARLYRAYLSECVAVMNANVDCSEISIVGDSVGGIFNTPNKQDIDYLFSTAAELNSMIGILNYKFGLYDIEPVTVGIGLAYGRALMIKAGYAGSGINEVVWMGDVVNEASNLSHQANSTPNYKTLLVSQVFAQNLNEHNAALLQKCAWIDAYHGYVINTAMQKWYDDNCA